MARESLRHKCGFVLLSLMPAFVHAQSETIPADHSNISELSAYQFVKAIRIGWNVGNSLEAMDNSSGTYIANETAWGNPKISQQLIDSVKAAGFDAIRLPVGWSQFSNSSTWTLKKEWLDRVEEVVNYALKRDMYVLMNEHWDGGWLQPNNAGKEMGNKRLAAIWKQVAIRFRDYGDHLIFAGTNEVMVTEDYNTPTQEYVDAQNGFNQTFVNTVRATGGRNAYRYLAVQAFNTNINHAVSFFKAPMDTEPNRLILEVHYYDPWEFTIDDKNMNVTQWGANGETSKKAPWDSDESFTDTQFAKMKTNFMDKGMPVFLGEYAAVLKSSSDNPPFRLAWDKYITQAAKKVGMVPFYWDPGFLSAGSSGLFDRNNGKQGHPDVIAAMISVSPISSPIFSKPKNHRNLKVISNRFIGGSTEAFGPYLLNGHLRQHEIFQSAYLP